MELIVSEQKELSPAFDIKRIYDRLNPWNKGENLNRKAVANALQEIFTDAFIYCGGHHVAAHNPITGTRMLLITGTSPDFS